MLIPSIDLQSGRVVQLVQGERLAWSSDDLDGWIKKFSGFPLVQVIDLDAAMDAGSNRDLVAYICERLPCQVGGGIRSVEAARAILAAGAKRVIVGSALFTSAGVDADAAREFSDAIGRDALVAAIDGRGGRVAVHGWKTILDCHVKDAIAPLEAWVGAFLATLIDGEGKLGGIDMAAAEDLRNATTRPLIVAGGIRSMQEVERLEALGIDAVVGMAIYTGLLDIQSPARLEPQGRVSAVIFDFDGVIADSEGEHLRAFQQTFGERGWELSEADYYGRYLGYSDREVIEMVAREHGAPLPSEELERVIAVKGHAFARIRASRHDGHAGLCPGAADVIRRLGEHFPLAIASSAFAHEIVEVLEAAELLSCFKVIVGAEDVAESKPSPAPYLEAARRLGIPPEACMAIEDSPWGLESAHRAGLRTIGITHTYPAARLTNADVIVKSLDEITESFVRDLLARTG
ncbi:MAG TPA: HAD-IA family hydrolase [Vicinamibacterales bacterium]|nr:HAD-IA family hydrolase [Vicinamibacterales bacterium]